jgi:DNA-binding phage protein
MKRLRNRAGFREAMLREGIDAILTGEIAVGKSILRDYVNATMGFERLAERVGIPSKSLMRMLGRNGNPQLNNIIAVIAELQRDAGIELHVEAAE